MIAAVPDWLKEGYEWALVIGAFGLATGTIWGGVYRLHKTLLNTIREVVEDAITQVTDKLGEVEHAHEKHYENHEYRIHELERKLG